MGLGNRIVSVVCAICLAVSFVAAGFVAVAVPDNATTSLADTYAGTTNPTTPFSHEELCDTALAGKRYTFDKNDRFALTRPFTISTRKRKPTGVRIAARLTPPCGTRWQRETR